MPSGEPTPPAEVPQPPPSGSRARSHQPWAYSVMWMVVCLLLVAGGLYVFKSCRDLPGETLDKTGKLLNAAGTQLEQLAAAFKRGTVTTTFASTATSVSGSQYLQVATVSQQEIFTRKDESSLAYGYIPLPDVIVEARAPVTYTYYLDLNDKWELTLRDGVIYVTAPDIKYNKPAVDVSRLEWEVKKDSMFRRTSDAMDNLRSSITYLATRKAAANVGLVRETGRHQTELFVENWLSRNFSDGKKYPVKVQFRGETATAPSVQAPKE